MSSRLTTDQIIAAANKVGYDPNVVRAVLQVETSGRGGYDRETGYLLIQFEPRWFKKKLPQAKLAEITAAAIRQNQKRATKADEFLLSDWRLTQSNLVEGQVRERIAFNAATRIHPEAAQLATSWGLAQIMGFNHLACGYQTVAEMVESFRVSEANQLAAMLNFIGSKKPLHNAMLAHDWRTIAFYYNGEAYAIHNYHGQLAAAYTAFALTPVVV